MAEPTVPNSSDSEGSHTHENTPRPTGTAATFPKLGKHLKSTPKPKSKKTKEELAKHAAANSKSNRLKGICKKVGWICNNDRYRFNGIVILHDLEYNKYTIQGSEEFVTRLKSNQPLLDFDAKRTFMYGLGQLGLTQKVAHEPSPTKMPKQMASFTPGNRQLYDLQNAALDRGSSPIVNIGTEPAQGTSGVLGKGKKPRARKINLGQVDSEIGDKNQRKAKRKYTKKKSLAAEEGQESTARPTANGDKSERDDQPESPTIDRSLTDVSFTFQDVIDLEHQDVIDLGQDSDADTSIQITSIIEKMDAEMDGAKDDQDAPGTCYIIGDWVAVIYDSAFWPGIIEDQTNDGKWVIKFLKPTSGVNKFAETEERSSLPSEEILCKLKNAPIPVSNRHWALPLEDYVETNAVMSTVLGI